MNTYTNAGVTPTRPKPVAATWWKVPVIMWAAIGSCFLCLIAYVWLSWICSPNFRPVPVGDDVLPTGTWLVLRSLEVIIFSVDLVFLWMFVVGPLWRERSISADGLLVLNFFLMWWADPLDNYVNFTFLYNGHALNMGSWAPYIPGWGYPNHENFAEPLAIAGGSYLVFWMVNAMVGCWVLRKLQERFPGMPTWQRLLAVFPALCAWDFIFEGGQGHLGTIAYGGVQRRFSLWPGSPWQFPLYEFVLIAGVGTIFTCLRYFKDDKGRFFVERGLERLQLSPPKQKLLTFLALAGFIQLIWVLYFVPYNLLAIPADTFPPYPSYLRTEICGEGTNYACPSEQWVPIPRVGGQLYIRPDDPRLPPEVRAAQRGVPYFVLHYYPELAAGSRRGAPPQ